MINADESFENYKALGDALMKIYEPEEAIHAYEKAISMSNSDPTLVVKLGKALR